MAEEVKLSTVGNTLKRLYRGKKRSINFDNWKNQKNKRLKNSGQPYKTYKGTEIPGKVAPDADKICNCSYAGCKEINIEQKLKLFNEFYKMSHNEQSKFLAECIQISEPKRRTVDEAVSKRQCSVKYTLPVNAFERAQVCQKFLSSSLRVTRRRLQVIIEKLKNDQTLDDLRGMHKNRPHKILNAEIQNIEEHIRSFPSQETHYSRKSNKKLCLNPDLSLKKMYNLFLEKYPLTRVKYHTYRKVFNEKFNLRFGVPRSDTCKLCDKYFMQIVAAETEKEKTKLQQESELHHRKAEKAYSSLASDTEVARSNEAFVVLCVDLQQVIFTPNLSHSDIYYQRQYSNYNLAIHNMGTSRATMCYWHESIGKRGSAEVASCILKYILTNYKPLSSHESLKLIIWSDRCTGQNNNWKMIYLCHYLISLKFFTEVNQKFLTTGHSFLPCDRDFAVIEKSKKTSTLYIPEHVIDLLAKANSSNPFEVIRMENEFVDFTPIESQIFKNPSCKITEARWLQITADNSTALRLRKTHNTMENWTVFELLKRPRGRNARVEAIYHTINPYDLNKLYVGNTPISAVKKNDLLKMIDYLPKNCQEFYINLLSE